MGRRRSRGRRRSKEAAACGATMEFAGALAVATWWATATVVAAALSRRLLAHWRNARRLRRSLRRFASPPCWPLIGNIHLVFGNGRGKSTGH